MNEISLIYFFAGILGAALILLMLTRNPKKNLMPFLLLVSAASFYSLMYGIEISMTEPAAIFLILRFEYLAIPLIPALWLIFVFSYTGIDKKLPAVLYGILFVIPVIVIITALSGYFIPLLYERAAFISYEKLVLISIVPGPVYLLNLLYMVTSFTAGVLILADFARHTHGIIKKQAEILILSGVTQIAVILAYMLWIGPLYHLDINPLAFLFTLFIAFLAIFQYRLFSLVPVAYGTVFENIPIGLVITDSYGYVIEANEAADNAIGADMKKDASKKIVDYCSDLPEFNTFMDSILNEDSNETEREFQLKTGSTHRVFNIEATSIKDRHANIEGFIILIRDITLQKHAENEIRQSEKRFRELFEQSPVAYVSLDKEGRIIGINPEFVNMTGYRWKDIHMKVFTDIIPENRIDSSINQFYKVSETGEIYSEQEIINKNGEILTVMISGRIQRDIAGNYIRSHFVLHDITERKRIEDSLSQANKKLNLLSRITRHDILNQLTVLKGYQELSIEHIKNLKDPDPKLEKYIEKESAAASIIYDQIKFTEDYQDIGVESPVWQNVSKIFTDSVKSLNMGDVRITIDTDDIEIYADPLLGKVFYNLVENSLKYGEDITEINISYKITDDSLVLSYKDNGGGIPDDEKENIFTRKFFIHSGLGLFLSREILAITNITIKETGVWGKGVVFEMTVPKGAYRI